MTTQTFNAVAQWRDMVAAPAPTGQAPAGPTKNPDEGKPRQKPAHLLEQLARAHSLYDSQASNSSDKAARCALSLDEESLNTTHTDPALQNTHSRLKNLSRGAKVQSSYDEDGEFEVCEIVGTFPAHRFEYNRSIGQVIWQNTLRAMQDSGHDVAFLPQDQRATANVCC